MLGSPTSDNSIEVVSCIGEESFSVLFNVEFIKLFMNQNIVYLFLFQSFDSQMMPFSAERLYHFMASCRLGASVHPSS